MKQQEGEAERKRRFSRGRKKRLGGFKAKKPSLVFREIFKRAKGRDSASAAASPPASPHLFSLERRPSKGVEAKKQKSPDVLGARQSLAEGSSLTQERPSSPGEGKRRGAPAGRAENRNFRDKRSRREKRRRRQGERHGKRSVRVREERKSQVAADTQKPILSNAFLCVRVKSGRPETEEDQRGDLSDKFSCFS
ncbi:hypothetical protein TGARI_297190 [Toxoplasma gondii ARI]|uniref:Uncharacterized protein n=1 Tax=Toxoplasma gondii ARI TaxID=1074872 RepID=A0A139XUP2_TOXGO|nr:hypothetical protein TGARI_297190 [Toxoplasma gondii ARI]